MNTHAQVRGFVLRAIALLCIIGCALFALFAASSVDGAPGHTGQAVALQAARNPGAVRSVLTAAGLNAGRYVYSRTAPQYRIRTGDPKRSTSPKRRTLALTSPVQIAEPTQTYDVFAPPPAFSPTNGALNVPNQTPVWTADERYLIFARQVTDADGITRMHLFSIAAKGDAPGAGSSLHQITSGPGNESFPTLNPANNTQFAFVSTAGNGVANLYALSNFAPNQTAVDVSTLTSLTIRSDLSTGFGAVGRPTWDPSGNRLAFSAPDTGGTYTGVHHIYYLFLSSGGGLSGSPRSDNPPAKFTDGPSDDTDPAWTPDGRYIAFASNAGSISGVTAPALTGAATTSRSIYLINGQGGGGIKITNTTVTVGGNDDFGPAWNSNINDTGALVFARSPGGPGNHDIYYFSAYSLGTTGTPVVTPEDATNNPAFLLNTDDNAGQTSATGNAYDDIYPTFAPFVSVFSVAYSSNRTVTYNAADGTASETAISIPQGGTGAFSLAVGANYKGLLVSRLFQIDAPTLLPYTPGEVIHVTDANGVVRRNGDLVPGTPVTFTVRLSNREAGNDDNNIYVQIKDPDSKYQDTNYALGPLEHKVFTQDNIDFTNANAARGGPSPSNNDSGSASADLYNGGAVGVTGGPVVTANHNATQRFVTKAAPDGESVELRGAVGGYDGNVAISLGYNGGGTNPIRITRTINSVPVNSLLPGGDPLQFTTFGQEYECQYVNAQFALNGTGDTALTDYDTPYYLAGVDDQLPGSAPAARPEWLKLTKAAVQDGNGGVLYTTTPSWMTPKSPSDYYMDVIAYDKASNWRIYDNVWGFSTQPFSGGSDILVVSDNTLGQKFVGTTFGANGLNNIPPVFYGAESYFTDIDIAKLPNAIYRYTVPAGLMPHNTVDNSNPPDDEPQPEVFSLEGTLQQDTNPSPVFNGLGVNSYSGAPDINQFSYIGGVAVAKSQQYSLWRILARGAVDPNVLSAYSPTYNAQPAVNDTQAGFTAPAADGTTVPLVPDAHRCVVWASPYTGDFPLNTSGSLIDSQTQQLLRAFVLGGQYGGVTFAGGGRLFVSGQNVASAITLDGNVPALNTTGSFVTDVLNASLVTPSASAVDPGNEGNQNLTAISGRLAGDAYFNASTIGGTQDFFTQQSGNAVYTYTTPSSHPFLLGNNYIDTGGSSTLWRTDGSLTQLGPNLSSFGLGANSIESQIDIIVPQNGAHTEANFAGPGSGATAGSATGVPGLIYNENLTTGQGRVVFASFGLEGLGIEYYRFTDTGGNFHYHPYNQRPNILHNIVSYLRTGAVTGTIVAGSGGGQGVPGATVYLVPNGGAAFPGNRQTFSALTASDGTFRIDGVEPGIYYAVAYKAGYTRAQANAAQAVNGDTSAAFSLNIIPVPPGSLSGQVTDAATGKGVPNASVNFDDGAGTTIAATTDSNGNYSISAAPTDTYTGTASATGYSTSAPQTGIVVSSGSATTANFVLTAAPATITVQVNDSATGLGLAGVTVAVTPPTGGASVPSQTTDANGSTTFTALPAAAAGSTYTFTASLNGYTDTSGSTTVTPGATTTVTLALTAIPPVTPGTLGGLVNDAAFGTPLGGATVSVYAPGGTTPLQTATTSSAATTPAAPTGDGAAQNYSISLQPGTYDVSVSKSGFSTTARVSVTITTNAFTRADFTGANAPQPIHVFPLGLNFFSVPYNYASGDPSFDTLFGTLNTGTTAAPSAGAGRSHVAVYQPQLLQYVLDPTPPADVLRLGQGYWVRLFKPAELTTPGASPGSATVAVGLHQGWNMIGVPSTSAINVASLSFASGTAGGSISFATAASAGYRIVYGTLYTYPAGAADGTPYTALGSSGSLQPWQAYWIYVYVDATLLIPTSPGAGG